MWQRITKLEGFGVTPRKLSAFSLIPCALLNFRTAWPDHQSVQLLRYPLRFIDTMGRFSNNWRFESKEGTPATVSVTRRLEANSPLTAMRAAEAGWVSRRVADSFKERQPSALSCHSGEFTSNGRGLRNLPHSPAICPPRFALSLDYLTQCSRQRH